MTPRDVNLFFPQLDRETGFGRGTEPANLALPFGPKATCCKHSKNLFSSNPAYEPGGSTKGTGSSLGLKELRPALPGQAPLGSPKCR